MAPFRCELAGIIASTAFTSGHRFVVGRWDRSPLGPMCDVMWAAPPALNGPLGPGRTGRRVLLVNRPEAGEFISAVYRFDAVEVVPIQCGWDGSVLSVRAGEVELVLEAGRGWRLPFRTLRSPAAARWIEAPLARRLLGVRVFGTSPTGVQERYRADRYRPVRHARAAVGPRDAGGLTRFATPTRFGFSEPPRQPSVVHVRPLLTDPSGTLGQIVGVRGRAGSGR